MAKRMKIVKINALQSAMWGLVMGAALLTVGCVQPDDEWGDEMNVGGVRSEQMVVGRERWRNFLGNVTSYRFVLNAQGLVDTVYYDGGYTAFAYYDEYRDVNNAVNDMVEMKVCGPDHSILRTCTFNIGANGYAKNATEVDLLTGSSYAWRFEYDRAGYLTRLKVGDDVCTFEYEDGNLVEYTNKVDKDETFYFSYSSISSHGYMPYFHAPGYIESDFGPILPLAYLAGLAGQPSANLPSSCEREQEFNEHYWTYEYRYVFSNEGVLVGLYYLQM